MKWQGYVKSISLLMCLVLLLVVSGCFREIKGQLTHIPKDATIIAFGDSLTYGIGATLEESYPTVLETLINRRVVNAGFPGMQTGVALKRLLVLLNQYHPKLVLLCVGGNDLLRGKKKKIVVGNIEKMVKLLQALQVQVVLIAVPELNLMFAPAPFYKKIAAKYDIPIEDKLIPALVTQHEYKADVVHLNAKGYRKLAEGLAKFLKEQGGI